MPGAEGLVQDAVFGRSRRLASQEETSITHPLDRGSESSFFFLAEDGIRFFHVTGVQTCALPILASWAPIVSVACMGATCTSTSIGPLAKIGRASCRERVSDQGVAGALKKKM